MGSGATYHYLPLPRKQLRITVRRFRTNKRYRSRTYRQLVFPVYLSAVREICVRIEPRKRTYNPYAAHNYQKRRLSLTLPMILIAAGLAGSGYFGYQTLQVKSLNPPRTYAVATPKPSKPKFLPRSIPTHITIPSVGIDVDTIPVDLDSKGSIQMPPLFSWLTGWYDKSPTPGEIGPAIIVGHVDTYKGISVFWHLRDVQPGATIKINRQDGHVATFRVDALKQFDQANFPSQKVYGNISYAGLRLITCGGPFDSSSGEYTQNTVVYASLVN